MATITRPVTKTLISTPNWGIPITDQVNLLTGHVNSLKPVSVTSTASQVVTTTSTVTGGTINIPAQGTALLICVMAYDLSAGTGTGFTNIVTEIRVDNVVNLSSYSVFNGAYPAGAVSAVPVMFTVVTTTVPKTAQMSVRTGAGPVHTVKIRGTNPLISIFFPTTT